MPFEHQLRPLRPLRPPGEDDRRAEALADDAGELPSAPSPSGPDDRDLARGGEVEVERLEQVGEALRMAPGRADEQAEDALGLLGVAVLAA